MDMIKTFVLLAIFLILAVGNIANIIRHHKEKKQAIAEGRIEKKEKRSLFSGKKKKESAAPQYDYEKAQKYKDTDEDCDA